MQHLPGPKGPRRFGAKEPPPRDAGHVRLAVRCGLCLLLALAVLQVVTLSAVTTHNDEIALLRASGDPADALTELLDHPGRRGTPLVTYDDFDIVYMYANGSDPEKAEGRVRLGGARSATARDRDNNELLYSLRSVARFMPWFRGNVIILTDTPPRWANVKHPRLRVVLHKDVFPDPATELPTYNSDAIFSVLGKIPGLKPYFVKFDDDTFVGAPVAHDDFIDEDGKPRIFRERHLFQTAPDGSEDEATIAKHMESRRTWLAKMYNTHMHFAKRIPECQAMLGTACTRDTFKFGKHAPVVMRRDVLLEIYELFDDLLVEVRQQHFRNQYGIDIHALYNWYCLVHGTCTEWSQEKTDKECKLLFLNNGDDAKEARLYKSLVDVLVEPPKFYTLNDELRDPNSDPADTAFKKLLPRLYSTPSEFELQ